MFKSATHTQALRRVFRFCLGMLFFTIASVALSQPLQAPPSEDTYTIKFNNVSASEVVRFVSSISGRNFLFDEELLDFKVTIVSDEPATVDEILALLIQVLRVNEFMVQEEGPNILIYLPTEDYRQLPKIVDDHQTQNRRPETGIITRVFRLQYLNVSKAQQIIRSMVSKSSIVEISPETRHLIVSDLTQNIERIESLLKSIDQPISQNAIEVYYVKHTQLDTLKQLTLDVMEPFLTESKLTIVPNPPNRSLYIVAAPAIIEKTLSVLDSLDIPNYKTVKKPEAEKSEEKPGEAAPAATEDMAQKPKSNEFQNIYRPHPTLGDLEPLEEEDMEDEDGNIIRRVLVKPVEEKPVPKDPTHFYTRKLEHQPGDKLLISIKQVASALPPDEENALLIGALSSLNWIEPTNSLVYNCSYLTHVQIEELINSLDTPVPQVFVEMLVIDTTIGNTLEFGVDISGRYSWAKRGIKGNMGKYSSSSVKTAVDGTSESSGGTLLAPAIPTTGFQTGIIGRAVTHNGEMFTTIGGLVKAIHTDNDTNIIMNPKVVAEHAVTAEFFMGDSTRFKTGTVSSTSGGGTVESNFDIREVGSSIRITPYLNSTDIVTLEVEQEDSSNNDTADAADSDALVALTSTSRTKTRVHVPDRHFVVLSGMTRNQKTHNADNLPCLGGVPLVNKVIGQKKDVNTKRNVLIFIRPYIIRNNDDAFELTDRFKTEVKDAGKLPEEINARLKFLPY